MSRDDLIEQRPEYSRKIELGEVGSIASSRFDSVVAAREWLKNNTLVGNAIAKQQLETASKLVGEQMDAWIGDEAPAAVQPVYVNEGPAAPEIVQQAYTREEGGIDIEQVYRDLKNAQEGNQRS